MSGNNGTFPGLKPNLIPSLKPNLIPSRDRKGAVLSRWTLLLTAALLASPVWADAPATISGKDTRLAMAAQQGDKDAVIALLKEKVDVNVAPGDGTTALHWAAYRGDVDVAKMLLKAGASLKATTRLGNLTPLSLAAKTGQGGAVAALLDAGADANSASATGSTPLMLASASGSVDAVKSLLDHGALVNAREKTWGESALMYAAALNRSDVVKLLLARGADWKATTRVEKLTKDTGYDPEDANQRYDNETPKDPAEAEKANKAAAARVKSASMRQAEHMGGMSALHFAARDGQTETVQALVAAGVDVNLVSAADRTSPMLQAIYNGHYDIGKYLLDHGADPKLVNDDGLSAAYAVIDQQWANRTWYPPAYTGQEKTGYLDLLTAILDKGANPNVQTAKKLWFRRFHDDWIDSPGATAFWRAAQANDLAAMKLLIAHGADPLLKTIHKASAMQPAAGYGVEDQLSAFAPDARLSVIQYMVEELHMDINATDEYGYTPLHGAAYMGDNELVKYMVAKGANLKAKSHGFIQQEGQTIFPAPPGKGDTVADMANGPRTHGIQHPDTVKLLESLGSENSHNCRSAVCLPEVDSTRPF